MGTFRRGSDIYEEAAAGEFVIRKRLPPLVKLAALFFVCFTLLYLVAINAEYLGGGIGVGLAVFTVIGPLCWFTIFLNQRNRDMVLAAEFQNALFSAAARLKTRFCIIVKQDGTVFYYDRGFQAVFPETANRGILHLDKILTPPHISAQDAKKLDVALANNESATIFMELPLSAGAQQKLVITVDPIDRPSRFFILRGRDYVLKQYDRKSAGSGGIANLSLLENQQGVASLYHMLQTLPIGLYTTDPEGRITFVNYTLESWLGYAQHEIVSRGITVEQLVPPQQNPIVDNLLLKDVEGPITLRTKDRKPVNVVLTQEITRDEHGAFIGTVARVQPHGAWQPTQVAEETGSNADQSSPQPF